MMLALRQRKICAVNLSVCVCSTQTQNAKQAAQQWHDSQAALATANKQAQDAAAAVAAKNKAASAVKAEADRLQEQIAELRQAGKRDAAKKAQQQAQK